MEQRAAGAYPLSVKAYDNLNDVTTSATVNIVVNTATNHAPSASHDQRYRQ